MRLVYKYRNYEHNDELMTLCRISKDLYNQALFMVKSSLKSDDKFLFYNDLDKMLKVTPNLEGEINYRKLKAQVAQQTIKAVDKGVTAYVRSIKDWSANRSKYKGKPHMPGYLRKDGFFMLTYTNQCCAIKDRFICLSRDLRLRVPQWEKYGSRLRNFNQVRILPRNGFTEIEIVYTVDDMVSPSVDPGRCASIDLGVGNLATMVTDFSRPIIYSGGQIKSRNRYFNKELARLKSAADRDNGRRSTKRIRSLWDARGAQMTDAFHKVSRHIVGTLAANGVGHLIIGYNSGWKDSIGIGKVNNQNFVMIPHERLLELIRYKCSMAGIRVTVHEESYTSKCDALAMEPVGRHDEYLGRRIKRGLFQSSTGRLINADVNGALNIMRKVAGDSPARVIAGSGLLFRPVKLNDLFSLRFANGFY